MPRPTPSRGPRKPAGKTAPRTSRLKPVFKKSGPHKPGLKAKSPRPAFGATPRRTPLLHKERSRGEAAPSFSKRGDSSQKSERGLVKKIDLKKSDFKKRPVPDRVRSGETRRPEREPREGSPPRRTKRVVTFSKPTLRAGKPVRKSVRSGDLIKRDIKRTPLLSKERGRGEVAKQQAGTPAPRAKSPLSIKLTSKTPRGTAKKINLKPSKPEPLSLPRRGAAERLPKHATPEFLQDKEAPGTVRLNKFIASAGITSRRKADELIVQGAVTINGKVIKELGTQVKPYEDHVTVNGETISIRSKHVYLLLNKPKDTITTTSDEKDRTTVLDYVETHERVYPIGRLDRNTTGTLLLTNDGELTNRLTHPSFEIEREYHVTLDKPMESHHARQIAEGGINIGEGDITGPAEISVAASDPKDIILKLREGKNREVRRLFETLGYEVEKLDRISFAGITHRGMSRGQSRPLSPQEVRQLRKLAGIEAE